MIDTLISKEGVMRLIESIKDECRRIADRRYSPLAKRTALDIGSMFDYVEAAVEKMSPPKSKPLTLERIADGPVYVEFKNQIAFHVGLFDPDDQTYAGMSVYKQFGVATKTYVDTARYGQYWRCWKTPPTQEEREAAQWEDET